MTNWKEEIRDILFWKNKVSISFQTLPDFKSVYYKDRDSGSEISTGGKNWHAVYVKVVRKLMEEKD